MDEVFQAVLMIAVVVAVVMVVVAAIAVALVALMTVGAVYGAGIALWNYGRAFVRNVKPVRVAP